MKKQSVLPMNALIILILVIVIAITLFAASSKINNKIDSSSRIEACSASIIAAASTKNIPVKSGSPRSYISCSRGDLFIKYEDIIVNDELDQQKLDIIIANSLKNAWDAVAQGKHDPFPDWEDEDNSEFKSACIIWDTVKFDKKLKTFLQDKDKRLYFSYDSLYTLEIRHGLYYSKYLFDKSDLPKNIKSKAVEIDEGTSILAKQYRGNLVDFWWNPLFFVYYFGKKCTDCSYLWSLDIVPSYKSFSDLDIEIKDEKFKVCDQIKN